jgi:hypothetical protein
MNPFNNIMGVGLCSWYIDQAVAWAFEELQFLCVVVTGHLSLLQSIPTSCEVCPVGTRAS